MPANDSLATSRDVLIKVECGTSAEEDSIASKAIIDSSNKCEDNTSSVYESAVIEEVSEEVVQEESNEQQHRKTGIDRKQSQKDVHTPVTVRGQNGDIARNSKTPPSPQRGRGSVCITPSATAYQEAAEDIVDGSIKITGHSYHITEESTGLRFTEVENIEKLNYQEDGDGEEGTEMTYPRQYAVEESQKAEEASNMILNDQQHFLKRAESHNIFPQFNAIVKNPNSVGVHQLQHHNYHHHHHEYTTSQQQNLIFNHYGLPENIAMKHERFTEQNILSRVEETSSISGHSSEGYENQQSPSQQHANSSNLPSHQHANVQSNALEHAFAVLQSSPITNEWKNQNSTTPSPLNPQNCGGDITNGDHHNGSPNSAGRPNELFGATNSTDSDNLHNLQSTANQNMSMLHQVTSYHQYNVSHENAVSVNHHPNYSR
ncbi:hypothetical protein PGB90_001295 [Kerria lacca]